MNPALISAGASLLGGLLGKPKNVSALRNRYDDVAGIFKAAEEFKFSPFALLGSPAVGPSVVQNTMGSAIADAGLLLADGMSKQKMKALEEERLRLENEKLRGEVNRMILRPKLVSGKTTIGAKSDPRKKQPEDPVLPDDPSTGPVKLPDDRLDRGTGAYAGGGWWQPAPGFSPANVIENEYGDIGQNVWGFVKFGADLGYNVARGRNYLKGKKYGNGPTMQMGGRDFKLAKPRKVWLDDGTYEMRWPK